MNRGRRVVVTAGAAGIGLATAEAFTANGDRVHICDIDERAIEQVTSDNPVITATVCDVSDRSAVEAFVEAAMHALGGIDVLVNNAGIAGPTSPVQEIDPDQWEAVLAVDLTGTFNVTRLCIPHLKKSDAGVILVMSSVGGRYGYPNRSPYATTKRGLIGFTETLAIELGDDGIRVNAIAPRRRRRRTHPAGPAGPGRYRGTKPGGRHRRRPEHPFPQTLHRLRGHRRTGALPRLRQRQVHHRTDHCHRRRLEGRAVTHDEARLPRRRHVAVTLDDRRVTGGAPAQLTTRTTDTHCARTAVLVGELEDSGRTAVLVTVYGMPVGVLGIADRLRAAAARRCGGCKSRRERGRTQDE